MKERKPRPAAFRYCVEFSKQGPARFLAHLDLQSAFERALRRARLPLAFSGGFHPHPHLVFEDALPLGWSSERERLWVDFRVPYPSRESAARLRRVLPPGLQLQRIFPWPGRP
ncbi:MAG: TIGR03936 family radical SAM-associated protein, partial [Planctomycetota bacterium]